MIDSADLMIGDYIKTNDDWDNGYKNKICRVTGLRDEDGLIKCDLTDEFNCYIWSDDEGNFEPIELTRKILLDNGFQKIEASHHDFFRLSSSKDYDEWSIEIDPAPYGGYFMVNAEHTSDEVYQGGIDDMKIFYVHELQHILTMLKFPTDIKLSVQP